MALIIDQNRCPQDHACPMLKVCPVNAITQDGYGLPKIDENKCIECGKCINYCPMKAVYKREE